MTKQEEVEELANILQGFVIEDSDLLKGRSKIFNCISHQRCMTIAEQLLGEYGYSKRSQELVPVGGEK